MTFEEIIFGVITNEVFDLDSKNCLTLLYNPEVSHNWSLKFQIFETLNNKFLKKLII